MATAKRIEDLEVYNRSMEFGDIVWSLVSKWDHFSKSSLGSQFVRASDSIAFNIAEDFGRFFFKENKQFCYYSRGSVLECKGALTKSKNRGLITENQFRTLLDTLEKVHLKLNAYLKSIGPK